MADVEDLVVRVRFSWWLFALQCVGAFAVGAIGGAAFYVLWCVLQ